MMTHYLLDTCTLSDLFKKIPATIEHFNKVLPEPIYISTISLMEIEYRLQLNLEREKKIRPIVNALLKQIQIIPFTETCARAAGLIRKELKTLGQLIGPYDILIAATAMAHECVIVTSNTDEFTRLPDITVEDWRKTK